MLGQMIEDPDGLEGPITRLPGLGLLPIHTTITPEKTTRQVSFEFDGHPCQGYEIHQGISDTRETILTTPHCMGTYIHGFLDNAPVIEHLLRDCSQTSNGSSAISFDLHTFKEEQYNKLAAHVRQYVDIPRIYQILSHE